MAIRILAESFCIGQELKNVAGRDNRALVLRDRMGHPLVHRLGNFPYVLIECTLI